MSPACVQRAPHYMCIRCLDQRPISPSAPYRHLAARRTCRRACVSHMRPERRGRPVRAARGAASEPRTNLPLNRFPQAAHISREISGICFFHDTPYFSTNFRKSRSGATSSVSRTTPTTAYTRPIDRASSHYLTRPRPQVRSVRPRARKTPPPGPFSAIFFLSRAARGR